MLYYITFLLDFIILINRYDENNTPIRHNPQNFS